MRNFIDILLSEIKPKPKRASIAVVINILSTLLLYLVFMVGLGQLLPRILFIDLNDWMFPGIVGFISAIIAFNLALQDSFHTSRETGLIDQIHSSPLLTYQIYMLKSLVYLLKSFGHLFLSSIVLIIVSGVHVGFFNLLAFWLYFLVGLLFINQFGLIVGIVATNFKVRSEFIIIFVSVIFMACGVIMPSVQYPGILGQIIHYCPVTILIEGGRDILVYNTLGKFYMIYLLLFSILSYFAAFLTFKQWISR
ncbi:MAG: ABC transporter permease [Candidatus Marinimicrobia bacterium]|nr:ABC transporter permease [Candidatus Neomarinimicrobiota bacterium]